MHVHIADIGLTVSCIMSTGFGEEVSDCALLQRARAKVLQLSDDVNGQIRCYRPQRCTLASHAVRPAHLQRRPSATEAGWRSVRSSHLYHCRRRRRPGYQLMGRHPHHCRTDCLYYGSVSQRAGHCHLAISTAEVLEAEVIWDL